MVDAKVFVKLTHWCGCFFTLVERRRNLRKEVMSGRTGTTRMGTRMTMTTAMTMMKIGEIGKENKQTLDKPKAPGKTETREALRLGLRLLRHGLANDLAQTILWVLCYGICGVVLMLRRNLRKLVHHCLGLHGN
jgi:hypothetical protein